MKSPKITPCFSLTPILLFLFTILLQNVQDSWAFDSLLQLPGFGNYDRRIRGREKRVLDVRDFGAKGNGISDDTEAFRNAWKVACSLHPRSTILIPGGNSYQVGPIDFSGPCRGKITLRVLGTVFAPEDPDVWLGLDPEKWIYFHRVNHLVIEGGGTVNGMGEKWWAESCKVNKSNPCHHAPDALMFNQCKDLQVRDLRMVDSQQMHMSVKNCTRVVISNIDVKAPAWSPNTDGIHLSSSTKVLVQNCIIRTGDDCISIVYNSSKILIKGVTCGPGHGISIGSLGKWNSWAGVHEVVVDGAFLANTKNGLRIKTWQGGSGFAAKITFQNVLMENVSHPIIVDQYYCDSQTPCLNQTSAVRVHDISFKNVKGTSASSEAIRFSCSDTFPCKRLYLEDVQLVHRKSAARSFCWSADGCWSGTVFPTPCFPSTENLIEQITSSPLYSM